MEKGSYFVAEKSGITFIRMVGNLKYTGSSGFDIFLDRFLQREYQDVVIDLTEASFLDSTNLGLIARIAERARKLGRGPVTIISPNDDVNRILESVRFDRIFRIIDSPQNPRTSRTPPASGEAPTMQAGREEELASSTGDRSEKDQLKMILRAHRTLIDLDEENRAEFQDVVDLLEAQKESID